jgi:hypothetical protein
MKHPNCGHLGYHSCRPPIKGKGLFKLLTYSKLKDIDHEKTQDVLLNNNKLLSIPESTTKY